MQVHSRVGRNDPVPAAVAEPPFRLRLLTRAAVKTDLGRCEGSRILGSSQGSRKRRFSESRGGHNKLSVAGSSIPPKTPRPCRLRLRRRRGRPHLALPCPPTLTRLSMERVLRPGRGHTCIRPWLTRRLVLCARACVRACVHIYVNACGSSGTLPPASLAPLLAHAAPICQVMRRNQASPNQQSPIFSQKSLTENFTSR